MTRDKLARLPEVLFEIGKAIGSDDDPAAVLSEISERVCELVDADACSVMVLDSDQGQLAGKAAHGLHRGEISGLSFRLGEGVAGWVVEHGEPALIGDVTNDARFVVLDDAKSSIRSMACVPLMARGQRVGALTATSARLDAFTPADIDLLGFIANTIALDVENIRLLRVSVTDPLTGAYNREFLQKRLPVEIETTMQRAQPLSLAMIDIDHFKPINDRFGHDVGDRVLAEVAARLRSTIRGGDLLVRYGGEEFLVLFPNTDQARAQDVGERMRIRLHSEAFSTPDVPIEVRISVGIAEHRPPELAGDLIRRADVALYAAKRAGRNRVEVAP